MTTYAPRSENFEAFLARLNATIAAGMGEPEAPDEPRLTGQIVGLPRSGTTVLYQLLARTRVLGYPSNVMAMFWQAPVVGARLQHRLANGAVTLSTTSIAGRTPEPLDPHEFGYFWRGALGHSSNSVHQDASPMAWHRLQATLDAVTGVFDAPVVYKNFLVLCHVDTMRQELSRQRYLAVRRPLLDVATSLLSVRRAIGVPDDTDFGLATSAPEEAPPDVLHRIAAQVVDLDALMSAAQFGSSADSILLDYGAICADPRGSAEAILDHLGATDLGPALDRLPTSLPPPASPPGVEDDERSTLARLIEERSHA